MRRFRNLSGTIMLRDEELVKFCVEEGEVVLVEILSDRPPYEFKSKLSNEQAVLFFLDDRLVPETRIGLQRDLERAGMKYFDPDAIIRYNNGNSMTDGYWVRFSDGPQSFKELVERRETRIKQQKCRGHE